MRKKLHRKNQSSNFLKGSFRDMQEPQSYLEEKGNSVIIKDDFSSEPDSCIFTSVAPVSLGLLNKINEPLPAPVHSVSGSIPGANSTCCHISDA